MIVTTQQTQELIHALREYQRNIDKANPDVQTITLFEDAAQELKVLTRRVNALWHLLND
jgi:ribonucleotide reductase beta subunit family protein with ferritin-like domain